VTSKPLSGIATSWTEQCQHAVAMKKVLRVAPFTRKMNPANDKQEHP
jgi:hypothetical protein